ncbi:MAG: hypothetical protein ACYC5H_17040, partial [Methylovirgula sp.]
MMEDAGLSRAQRIFQAQVSSRLQMARAPAFRTALLWLGCLSILVATTVAAEALQMKLRGNSGPEVVFDSAHDGCAAEDMPDINARAFRNAQGDVVMFALYDMNRALRGKDPAHLKLDCHVVLASHFDPDPAHYDDRNFLTATWTTDGQNVVAL